jgi:hypothetical protein
MNVESWLPLLDYSAKYKVSVSTLRRKIKIEDINYRFEDGKYFISDEPMGSHHRIHRPSQKSEFSKMSTPSSQNLRASNNDLNQGTHSSQRIKSSGLSYRSQSVNLQTPKNHNRDEFVGSENLNQRFHATAYDTQPDATPVENKSVNEESVLNIANRLLNELKKAYTQVVDEKDKQLIHLKEEIADLKTLVRVLEDENERIKRRV